MAYDPSIHHRRSIRLKGFDYTRPGAYFITIVTHQRASLFGEIIDGVVRLNEWGEIARVEWMRTPAIRREIALDEFIIMPNHMHAIVMIMERDNDRSVTDGYDGTTVLDGNVGAHGCAPNRDLRADGYDETTALDGNVGAHGCAPNRDLRAHGCAPNRDLRAHGCAPDEVRADGRPPLHRSSRSLASLIAGYKSAVTARINKLRGSPGTPIWQQNYWEHVIRNEGELSRVREYIRGNPLVAIHDDHPPS